MGGDEVMRAPREQYPFNRGPRELAHSFYQVGTKTVPAVEQENSTYKNVNILVP